MNNKDFCIATPSAQGRSQTCVGTRALLIIVRATFYLEFELLYIKYPYQSIYIFEKKTAYLYFAYRETNFVARYMTTSKSHKM